MERRRTDGRSLLEGGATAPGRCPECRARLVTREEQGVPVEECPAGHGVWVTPAQLRLVGRRHESWLGRLFHV